ncbi:hypothetical protein KFK09_022718 [Dendrobium nobile]|uniref:Uncharacterized protein n=1 Tax=Dendrobium nobile TaxID=94219 RepID=A0A8T3AKQ3_DENNO|nr:hypothetical protein KFK09_022718 [Dendrobium nobile]
MTLLYEFDELNKKYIALSETHDSLTTLHFDLEKLFKELKACVNNLDHSEHYLKIIISALKSANEMLLKNVKAFQNNMFASTHHVMHLINLGIGILTIIC